MVSAGGRSSSPGLSGTRYEVFASLLLAVVTPAAYAADSLVRIDCLDETDGAAVYLDGEYQFDCEPFAKRPILTRTRRATGVSSTGDSRKSTGWKRAGWNTLT